MVNRSAIWSMLVMLPRLCKSNREGIAGVVFPHPVEVGPSENMSVGEIAQLINEIAGGKSEIVNLP